MIKMVVLVKRQAHLTREEFSNYWRNNHGPLVASVTESSRYMRKYVQNHITPTDEAITAQVAVAMGTPPEPDPAMDFDGMLEIWYDSLEDFQKFGTAPRYLDIVRPDEVRFTDPSKCKLFIFTENTVFDEHNHPAAAERMKR